MNRFRLFLTILGLSFLCAFSNANAQTNVLIGGDMENSGLWQTSFLDTGAGQEPSASWNYTTDMPTAGLGGNLHVQGSTNTGNSQYCIYQELTLSSDKVYTFDGAFKALAINNSWCEVYIGTQPVDGVDYGPGQTRLAAFGTWAGYTKDDGIFSADIDAANYTTYTPATSGQYYFVMKMGSTSWDATDQAFEIIVDELSLIESREKPITNFSADVVNGYAPMQVQFTDESIFSTSWSWDFGDGSALSTDQNPVHTYSSDGVYTVSLTASNEIGDTPLVKTDYINVNPALQLTAGGVLVGGEMDDATKWSTTFLSTPAGSEPIVSWNNTVNKPTAGRDGALFVTGLANNSTVQYCIYQKVTLSKDSIYEFDAAMRDFTTNLNQAWYEVYIGPEPIDGLDYSKDDPDNFLLAEFSTWSTSCNPKGVDGTFMLNACGNNAFIPPSDGDYYFVLKLGSTSWGGDDMPFALALDELSLTGSRVKPIANFSADKPNGFVPLTVQFTDESDFVTSWSWNFGDGSALSTEQNPVHVYAAVGTYDVTLSITNEKGSTILAKTGFIKVNTKPTLPAGEMLYGGNMEDPNLWNITPLNATASTSATWNNTANTLSYGVGGNLLLSADVLNTQSQYCIWQAVDLKAGMKYTFTGAFKDLSTSLDHFWSEVYIGSTAPADGADYGDGQTKIAFFNTWDCGSSPGLDGTYQDNACSDGQVGVFVPDTDGTYYFAIKTGMIDWENTAYSYSVMIDELSLMESENIPAPVADFFADVTSGDAPLTVYFTDLSTNASSWFWDFGDGNTSTDQSPIYTYHIPGTFSVSLTAYNDDLVSNTLVVPDLITVFGTLGIDELSNMDSFIYPNPATDVLYISNIKNIKQIDIYNVLGHKVRTVEFIGNKIKVADLPQGVYILSVQNHSGEYILAKFLKN